MSGLSGAVPDSILWYSAPMENQNHMERKKRRRKKKNDTEEQTQ